jgi:hypothetical protein
LFKWILNGVFFAIIIFYILLNCLDFDQMNSKGHMADIWAVSITLYTCIIIVFFQYYLLGR